MYIADFIKLIQREKQLDDPIPISCFTATAKQKVIGDIKTYFKDRLSVELDFLLPILQGLIFIMKFIIMEMMKKSTICCAIC